MERPKLVQIGKLVEIVGAPGNRGNPNPPKRSTVKGFSRAARRRMARKLATLGEAVPIFVTLTYGAEWSRNPEDWKRHLDTWLKCLGRAYPEISGIWRLEPQKRGAPHYHLLLYGGRIDKAWLSESWARCSEDESPEHVAAGTNVQAIRSSNGAAWYCSKYMAKAVSDELSKEWRQVGKWWGIYNREKLPVSPRKEMELSPLVLSKMLSFFRSEIEARMASRVWREFKDLGGPPPSELEAARLESWVVPKSLISDPAVFFQDFSAYIRDQLMQEVEVRYGPENFARIAPMVRRKLEAELEGIARSA